MIKIIIFSLLFGIFPTAAPARAAETPEMQDSAPDAEKPSPTLAELLKQIEAAYRRGNYELGLSLVKKAFELKRNDVSTMDRIGSVYYVLGRYGEALTVWTRALPLERDVKKRRELENSILVARRSLGLVDAASPAAASTAPVVAAPAVPPKHLSAQSKASIQALYKTGVKYYASGQYLQATTAFLRVLQLDPGNADAEKALKRLKLDR